MDLSSILASPKIKLNSNVKSKCDQMDKILKRMDTYDTTKVDIEKLNQEAKLEAKKVFYEEIDALKLNLPKLDQQFDGFNKICFQINKGLKKEGIFKNQPFIVFKKEDLFDNDDKNLNEKLIKDALINEDKLKLFKTGLKMISMESNLDNILIIKKILIDEVTSVMIVDIYATLIKILINWGIDLELLDRYVIKYRNIKDNASLKRNKPILNNAEDDFGLNLIQSFIHIVDIIEISVNSLKIIDQQMLADFVSIVLILHSDKQWRFNEQCLNSLAHLFAFILKRVDNTATSIKIVSKTILRFFKGKNEEFFEFLDFFPDNTVNLTNIKFALCKISLKKYGIKVGHTELRIKTTFALLKELKLNSQEMKLVISFIDHFYKTRELNETLSQLISDEFAKFTKEFEFEYENQNSIDLRQYLNGLIDEYDRKPRATPVKKRKVKGESVSRPRKMKKKEDKEIKKIWQEFEQDLDLNDNNY